MTISEVLLWLFIINLGIAYGAGLYETRIILPQWFTRSPENKLVVNSQSIIETNTGRKFWSFVTTLPLTLLTIANLIVAWTSSEPRHFWWMAASLITLVERIGTFSFFIPTAIKLMKVETLTQNNASRLGTLWVRLNHVRNLLNLLGWLAAIRVLSLPA